MLHTVALHHRTAILQKGMPSFASLCVSVPENPPMNVSAVLNGTEVLMTWEGPPGRLNGELQGYRVEYQTPAAQPVSPGHVQSQTKVNDHILLTTVAFFLWTALCGYRVGHRAVPQPVGAAVQCVLPSLCLHRGREGALDPHTDSDSHQPWWVANRSCTFNQ